MSLYNDLLKTSKSLLKKPAVFYNGKFVNYENFIKRVDFYGDFFRYSMKFHEQMSVSLCLENSLNTLAIIYALNKIGVIINFINPNLPVDQIQNFDSITNTRILILEKKIYQENFKLFESKKNKIAVIDSDKLSFKKLIRNFKYRKKFIVDVPLNFKEKFEVFNYEITTTEKSLAITCSNERFDEHPYIACFDNKALSYALINQKEIYSLSDSKNYLGIIFGSMLSLPMFLTFFHAMLCSGVCVSIDENYFKRIYKASKKTKILVAADDYQMRQVLKTNNKKLIKILKKVTQFYIYNDINRTSNYDNIIKMNKNAEVISLLGTVETCGAILKQDLNDKSLNCFGYFLNDVQPFIDKQKKRSSIGELYVKTNAKMLGYYKETVKNDQMITTNGINTYFSGMLDEHGRFNLIKKDDKIFNSNSPYLYNLKEVLLTIPGLENVDIIASKDNRETTLFLLKTNKNETNRIINDANDYLKMQFKGKNINYKIEVKN